jgi:hypothetical protein
MNGLSVYMTDVKKIDLLVVEELQKTPIDYAKIAKLCWDSNVEGSRMLAVAAATIQHIEETDRIDCWLDKLIEPYRTKQGWWRAGTLGIVLGVSNAFCQYGKQRVKLRGCIIQDLFKFYAEIAGRNHCIEADQEEWNRFETGLNQSLKPALKHLWHPLIDPARNFYEMYCQFEGSFAMENEEKTLARIIVDQFTFATIQQLKPGDRLLRLH